MEFVFVGTVKKKALDHVEVFDHQSKETHTLKLGAEDLLESKEGDSGIFFGEYQAGVFSGKRFEFKKILNPLYEEDLFEKSGAFTLIMPVDDPFPTNFVIRIKDVINEPTDGEAEVPCGTVPEDGGVDSED